ncbi:iron-siderophore ABC transporter substrate-binding protein [Paenibacillus hemerocallicola]|uniref:Iron-siderophore ABC transporter substrate-binding protein n=1 Tax=Paenibacillus hemerocallicola TaxID=1172614 RepID=A0A5C4T5E8_9BACL|nr:iron-siderophore ABC transporter substrate-binding protein [Paenibacillus hemerocallicola]TNJ63995.1 iron-siderophore ABC transporter substrate-binding protein [Paenibacillus hemerocallicola]
MKLVHLLLAIIFGLSVVGCSAAAPGAGSDRIAAEPGKQTSGTLDSTEKIITHAMGTVTLKKAPERVVYLFQGMVDIGVAIGAKSVGAVESSEERPWFHYLRAQMSGVKSVGALTQPNLEVITSLKPDLIIGAKSRAEQEKIYPQLSAIAPTIMMNDVFDWKTNVMLAGEALYKEAEAAAVMKEWDTKVQEFKQKMGNRLSNTEASIIRFEKDGSSRFFVTGFAGTIFQELGLVRPKVQQVPGKTVVSLTSKEHMSQLDGDIIFDITQLNQDNAPATGNTQTEWTSHPLWKSLKGVQNEKYFKVNVVTWNLGGGPIAAKALLDDLFFYFDINKNSSR